MLPRLSKVHDYGNWIYFFIEIKREVLYAVAEKDNEFWWVEKIVSTIDKKERLNKS